MAYIVDNKNGTWTVKGLLFGKPVSGIFDRLYEAEACKQQLILLEYLKEDDDGEDSLCTKEISAGQLATN